MDKEIEALITNWQKRNIQGIYCASREEAQAEVLSLIPENASIGFSGSVTLKELEIIEALKKRGGVVFDPYKEDLSREESLAVRRQATLADYYLASPNAISKKGELVFFSAWGNRIAGICYGKNVILVAGINKIAENLDEAIKRAREYATPLNCKRLNWDSACLKDGICRKEICFAPQYKRMCCQILIIEAEVSLERLKVILVGEKLGY
ncbi:MAG: lactate utilization protein [Candidatus Omnitrophica bacterium]|nr:lactate utilization protein [Candidatus Omnitrophota bacterium]